VALVSRRLLEEIQAEKEKYNATFDTSPSAILLTRMSDGKIIEVNDGFQRMMGYEPAEVIGKTTIGINLWNRESDRDAVLGALYLGKEVLQQETQFRNQNGDHVIGLLSSKMLEIDNERCLVTNISNVTEMVKMRQDLRDLAIHDSLTGLPNRILFYDRFEIAKASAQRENEKIAVISMDIDFLKKINDEMGHAAGDVVLATVSSRMSNLLRKVDSVARFGGDEFALLIWGMKQIDDVMKVVENLQRIIAEPITIGENTVSISVSMGIAIYPEDGYDILELLKQSDTAMYRAKRDGRNNIKFSKEQN
jgi:diguanylate cyclase (GGDEF)-like protein/PAS domain S-box-containing protein